MQSNILTFDTFDLPNSFNADRFYEIRIGDRFFSLQRQANGVLPHGTLVNNTVSIDLTSNDIVWRDGQLPTATTTGIIADNNRTAIRNSPFEQLGITAPTEFTDIQVRVIDATRHVQLAQIWIGASAWVAVQ